MFGLPTDATWIWVGLVIGSAAMLGVVVALPAAPPDAVRAAETIESVTASEYAATASIELRASAIRLAPDRLGLRGPGGTAHASIRYGPITPVGPDSPLESLLDGRPPASVFDGSAAFRAALERARARTPTWREAGETLQVRRVRFGEVSSVLVGA
ncbi:MAG: hypothetical protein ABEJ60_05420 [Halodesulfurarchaeum sp.]